MQQFGLKGKMNTVLIKRSKNTSFKNSTLPKICLTNSWFYHWLYFWESARKLQLPTLPHNIKNMYVTRWEGVTTQQLLRCMYPLWTENIAYWTKWNLRITESKYLSEFFNFSTLDTNNASCQTLVNKKSKLAVEVAAFVVLIL